MAGIGSKLALALKRGFQPIKHAIKSGREFSQFITLLQLEAAMQIGLADLLGCACNCLHGAHGSAGQPVASDDGKEQYEGYCRFQY